MFVCCECCALSGRGLCDELITRPEESYRLRRVVVCDLETSNEEAKVCYGAVENTTKKGCNAKKANNKQTDNSYFGIFRCCLSGRTKLAVLLLLALISAPISVMSNIIKEKFDFLSKGRVILIII